MAVGCGLRPWGLVAISASLWHRLWLELPKGPTGKIFKNVLWEGWAGRTSTAGRTPTRRYDRRVNR
jgi:hypothetical protein